MPRWMKIAFVFLLLGTTAGESVLAQSKPPGGLPPGVPPPGTLPPGVPPGLPPTGAFGPGALVAPPPGVLPSGSQIPHRSTSATHSSLGFGPVGRWWDDRSVIRAIGLRAAQQHKMDVIFNANKPAILASYKTFLSAQKKLDELNKNPSTDKARLFSAIDVLNQARASLQKATAQMLLEIRAEMAPDQIAKLEKLPNQ